MKLLTYPLRIIWFWLWYFKEFWSSNWAVLKDIITPGNNARPGILRYECHSLKDWQYVLLACLITITPGTLVVGSGRDTDTGVRVMYVHGIYSESKEELKAEIRDMEDRMLNGLMYTPKFSEGAQ